MAKRSRKRPAKGGSKGRASTGRSVHDWAMLGAEVAIWAALLIPPFLVWPRHADSFELPKLLWSETLALVSLLALVPRLAAVGEWSPGAVWRRPVIRAVLPAVLVASLGWIVGQNLAHTREALPDLWIAAACLVAWSLALPADRHWRLLAGLLLPALAIGVIAILQFHDLYRPFEFAGGEEGARLGVTSLAGNTGVLADYLLLPALIAQWLLLRGWRRRHRALLAAGAVGLGVTLYALAVTQTVVALAAVALGSAIFWGSALPRRRALQAAAAAGLLLLIAVAAVGPLRQKVTSVASDFAAGNWDRAMAGRLDGWRAAGAMFAGHPVTGVGHGGYGAEFASTKLALSEQGVSFFRGQDQPMFVNAHNEPLEVAAEWGVPGLLALGWGVWVLLGWLRRRWSPGPNDMDAAADEDTRTEGGAAAGSVADRALAWGGVTALAVTSLGHFPFRVALVAYPAVLFLSWTLRSDSAEAPAGDARPSSHRRAGRWIAAAAALVVVLALAGQLLRVQRLESASRSLRTVEQVSLAVASRGQVPPGLLWNNVKVLQTAHEYDPADSRILLTLGSQYLLLGRADEAIAAYQEAITVEPRPEIYLNLGRAQQQAGDLEAARESYRKAIVLDPQQRPLVPRRLQPGRLQ